MRHGAISLGTCSHILVRDIDDRIGHWHGPGVSSSSSGNVFLLIKSQGQSSPELHASFPYATLYDNVEMGLLYGRFAGSVSNLPNHLENLVLWNYNDNGAPIFNYKFWRKGDSNYGRVVMPIVVGFHGGFFSFDETQLKINESFGTVVMPASLYEAQYQFRHLFDSIADRQESRTPVGYSLKQNYPNPFNPTTVITYSLDRSQSVELSVYNIVGEHIATLVNKIQAAGTHRIVFSAQTLRPACTCTC